MLHTGSVSLARRSKGHSVPSETSHPAWRYQRIYLWCFYGACCRQHPCQGREVFQGQEHSAVAGKCWKANNGKGYWKFFTPPPPTYFNYFYTHPKTYFNSPLGIENVLWFFILQPPTRYYNSFCTTHTTYFNIFSCPPPPTLLFNGIALAAALSKKTPKRTKACSQPLQKFSNLSHTNWCKF